MEVEINYQFKTLNTNEDSGYEKAQQCVKNIIKRKRYTKFSVDKKVFTGDGGSFLGIFYEVNIKGQTEHEEKEHNLFLKIITPGEQMTMLSLSEAYMKELFVYSDLSKVFKDLQDKVNVPLEDRFKMVKSYKESTANVIVLDNMKKKGYSTYFRMDTLTIQYAELAVKELAKFHALSFVLEYRRPIYYEKKIKTVKQPLIFNEDMQFLIRNMCHLALKHLEENNRNRFKNFVPIFLEKYRKLMLAKSVINVLCHGDYRPSNILIKEKNDEIKELIPIDYQLIYHGCPVMDLMYLIFSATDRAFRKAHLSHLKEFYYSQLGTFLKHFNLDVVNVYPKQEYEKHFKERLEYGLLVSINLVPFLMANDEAAPDLTGDMATMNFNVDSKYKNRVNDLVADFIEWGYL